MNMLPQPSLNGFYLVIRPHIRCADGFTLSVQASAGHYCSPRTSEAVQYDTVEVGYPSAPEPLLDDYSCGDGVYACVPTSVVQAILNKHGGPVALVYPDEGREVPCGADLLPCK